MFSLKSTLITCLLSACALAQSIVIASPADGAVATPGQPMNVELDFPNQLTGVQHVSVVISLQNCAGQPCTTPASDNMGSTLYSGEYNPQYHEGGKPPYQNFTVTIPEGLTGTNVLNVAHFMLLGASAEPILEFKNASLVTNGSTPSARSVNIRGRRFE